VLTSNGDVAGRPEFPAAKCGIWSASGSFRGFTRFATVNIPVHDARLPKDGTSTDRKYIEPFIELSLTQCSSRIRLRQHVFGCGCLVWTRRAGGAASCSVNAPNPPRGWMFNRSRRQSALPDIDQLRVEAWIAGRVRKGAGAYDSASLLRGPVGHPD
jgi:hypothetical protein